MMHGSWQAWTGGGSQKRRLWGMTTERGRHFKDIQTGRPLHSKAKTRRVLIVTEQIGGRVQDKICGNLDARARCLSCVMASGVMSSNAGVYWPLKREPDSKHSLIHPLGE